MNNTDMRTAFRREMKGVNILTPNVLRFYGNNVDTIVELTVGTGFTDNKIYGVTVGKIDANGVFSRDFDASTMFDDEDEAVTYITTELRCFPF